MKAPRLIAQFVSIFLFVGITHIGLAQSGGVLNGLDGDKYTPKQAQQVNKNKRQSNLIGNNIISYSLSHLLRQMAVLSYERHFGERYGLKVSGGYCFGKDLMQSLSAESSLTEDYNDKDLYDIHEENEFAQQENHYADITGKVYTNINESSFYDLLYRVYGGLSYRNYRQTYLPVRGDVMPAGVNDIRVNNQAVSLVIGQYVYRENGISLEYYLGIGRRTSRYHGFTRDQSVSYDFMYDQKERKENKLLFTVGVAYGICF
jgi:hypothetical protein